MQHSCQNKENLWVLSLGAMGIVYGDIGTSPLYTLKTCFSEGHFPVTPITVLGLVSLIFWSLLIIVSLKYAWLMTKADNKGEGGILSLSALVLKGKRGWNAKVVLFLGLIGASLFFGDGIITPAISVLSAVEGLSLASPIFEDFIIPLCILILMGLFMAQKRGSANIGRFFGPIMLVWFLTLAILGGVHIIKSPYVLKALNPWYAYSFFCEHGWKAFFSLGAVVLAVTGAEALYADLGHFGRPSIVRTWNFAVFPCLVLNYFGQAALLISTPEVVTNPFYHLVPSWGLYPLIGLSTLATVIASQAVISGVFSLVWQAVQLGYLPRMHVIHTSSQQIGQVFLPMVNRILFAFTVLLVMVFKTSDNLAAAYGFAVVGLMVITTLLTATLVHSKWKWSVGLSGCLFVPLLLIDLSYFFSNTIKIPDGGWLSIMVGLVVFCIFTTWIRGRAILIDRVHTSQKTIKTFLKKISETPPVRTKGVAVYLTGTPDTIPTSLVINLKHNHILHEKVILLSIVVESEPRIPRADRVQVQDLGCNIYQVTGYYGFMEVSNIPAILERCQEKGLTICLAETSFFLSRGIPVSTINSYMQPWREHLFIFMAKNALNATEFFKIPDNHVVELGIRFKV